MHELRLNSLRPSDAYMRQLNIPTLIQLMVCRLFGAKPLSQPMLLYCHLDPKKHISGKFYSINSKGLIQENALENVVCKMAAILSRPQCPYTWRPGHNGCHFTGDIFKFISCIEISLEFVPKASINNMPASVQIMVLCRSGDKSLSEPETIICIVVSVWTNGGLVYWRIYIHTPIGLQGMG